MNNDNFDMKEYLHNHNDKDLNIYKLYLHEIYSYPPLSKKEMIELLEKKDTSKEAFNKLYNHSLRLVYQVAKPFSNSLIDIMDLIQEGNIALIRAIKNYNYKHSNNFKMYVFYGVRRALINYIIENKYVVKWPAHVGDKIYKIISYIETYTAIYNEEPSKENILKNVGVNEYIYNMYCLAINNQYIESLDKPIYSNSDEESDKIYGDKVEFSDYSIDDTLSKISGEQIFDNLKLILPEKYLEALRLRLGYYGKEYTLQEIANKYGFTREYARQLVNKAVEKVKENINDDYECKLAKKRKVQ